MSPAPPLPEPTTTAEEFAASPAFVHAPVAYSVIDLDGNQVAANPAFRELFGSQDELVDVAGITHAGDRERTRSYLEALREGRRDRVVIDKRYLRADGTSFQALLASTRESLARHYLCQSQLPAAEISFLLGYEDLNSFYRAFNTWTGSTPETVRASAVG